MSEPAAVYNVQQPTIGPMPPSEVYAALDYVLAGARCPTLLPQAQDAGQAFLMRWFRTDALPSAADIEQSKAVMAEQIEPLVDRFRATLQMFVNSLDEHPCPLPGTVFGDYYADLVQLQDAVERSVKAD